MNQPPFHPGDHVKHPTWGDVVLTVTRCEPYPNDAGFCIEAEYRWTAHSTAPGISREVVDRVIDSAVHFTLYAPRQIPVLQLVTERVTDRAEMLAAAQRHAAE